MATAIRHKQIQTRPFTVDDFDALPEDGNRYEVIGGVLRVSPAPEIDHQLVQARLFGAFLNFLDLRDAGVAFVGPTDVQFSQFDIVEPDIVVVLNDNFNVLREKRIVGAPDILVEIVSPLSGSRDRVRKAVLYALNGVREYWLVEPKEKTVIVLTLVNGVFVPIEQPEGIARSVLLDGFDVPLDRLFRPIGPVKSSSEATE